MGKRSSEDVLAKGNDANPAISGLSRKKSKNKKSESVPVSNVVDKALYTTTDDVKKENPSKKRKKQNYPSVEPHTAVTAEENDVDAAKAAKAARKEAKRAKKASKEAEPTEEPNGETVNEVTHGKEDTKAARKAEREAEKAKLKALTKEGKKNKNKQLDAVRDTDTATPSEALSSAGSLLPSKEHSSATSPGPAPSTTKPLIGDYVEDSELATLPQSTIDEYLRAKEIAITDPVPNTSKYRPITSFSYLPIKDRAHLAPFSTFDSPTPIQAAAWPCLFAGRDVVGVAETGSGKTFAFGVPCIQAIVGAGSTKTPKGVKSVIISPTRELASQIHDQMLQIAKPAGLFTACIYGGVPKDPQYEAMKKANIVVATPGRLNDLISEGVVDLSHVNYLVLDEADRMLEKGFEEEIRKIIGQTPTAGRQTLMFTATWPPSVRDLAGTFMRDPIKINIGDNHSGELRANTRIAQVVEVVDPAVKQTRLLQLLKTHQSGKYRDDRILVFCLYKKEATRIEGFIRSKGLRVAGIHGDLSQVQRTASLEAFKKGAVPILVATDVAARGLDIPAVKVVINVTFPLTAEDYVHRIGRTGRAGQDGLAITLFTEHDKSLAGALVNVLNGANQPVPEELLKFGTTVKKKGHEAYGAFYKDTENMKKATKITFD